SFVLIVAYYVITILSVALVTNAARRKSRRPPVRRSTGRYVRLDHRGGVHILGCPPSPRRWTRSWRRSGRHVPRSGPDGRPTGTRHGMRPRPRWDRVILSREPRAQISCLALRTSHAHRRRRGS